VAMKCVPRSEHFNDAQARSYSGLTLRTHLQFNQKYWYGNNSFMWKPTVKMKRTEALN
jgi:hypothetical protein